MLLCHRDKEIDFKTLQHWFQRNKFEHKEFRRMECVSTSDQYKNFMWKDYGSVRYGMEAIMSKYGSAELKAWHGRGGHHIFSEDI